MPMVPNRITGAKVKETNVRTIVTTTIMRYISVMGTSIMTTTTTRMSM